jgi:purine nucleoside phosphorylase
MSIQIGIIGGSGLYDMADLQDRQEVHVVDAVRRAVGAVRHRAR